VITLDEMQFEILPNEGSTSGVGFGIYLDVSVDDGGFDPGENEWVVQDTVNEKRGSTNFGRDTLLGPTWTWAMHVNRDDVAPALETLGLLRAAWSASDIVQTPGKMAIIRYRVGGRDRRVYGRPRRWASPPNNLILNGRVPITATFKTVDAMHYEDLLSTTTIPFSLTSDGGFEFPVVFPAATLPSGQREGQISVGGDSKTYPVIRFNGPITNPYLQCDNLWKVKLNMGILAGSWVEIDTRPWKLSVLRNGLYSEAGKIERRTRLENLYLTPGLHDLAFGGESPEGTATATVSWRGAFASL
jgi:hypothetical protein